MGMFQIPWLPEALIRLGNYAALRKTFAGLPKQYMSDMDVERYVEAARQPGALTAMINWYRALPAQLRNKAALPDNTIRVPTCVLWGERDAFLSKACNETLPAYVPDLELHYLPESSHWVQLDAPDEVNRLLLAFLAK